MKYIKLLLALLLLPAVALANGWDTQYKQIEQSIRHPQFGDKVFNITKYGASTKATADRKSTRLNSSHRL